jgi:hypothetical protein
LFTQAIQALLLSIAATEGAEHWQLGCGILEGAPLQQVLSCAQRSGEELCA